MISETLPSETSTDERKLNDEFHLISIEKCVAELKANSAYSNSCEGELIEIAESIKEFCLILYDLCVRNNNHSEKI